MRYQLEEMSGDKYERKCPVGKFEGERNARVVNVRETKCPVVNWSVREVSWEEKKCPVGEYERKQMSGR